MRTKHREESLPFRPIDAPGQRIRWAGIFFAVCISQSERAALGQPLLRLFCIELLPEALRALVDEGEGLAVELVGRVLEGTRGDFGLADHGASLVVLAQGNVA